MRIVLDTNVPVSAELFVAVGAARGPDKKPPSPAAEIVRKAEEGVAGGVTGAHICVT
jgi:hypothetical protein